MVQNSSVLYFCSPLSHCSVNVNVFKYSSQIPFVKNKTFYILAFICYIKLSYGIKQNLKDKEILRGLVFSSDCWLWSLSPQHYSETYIACHVRSFEMHPQAISHKRSKHSKRSVFIEACNRPSYAVTCLLDDPCDLKPHWTWQFSDLAHLQSFSKINLMLPNDTKANQEYHFKNDDMGTTAHKSIT